MEIIYGKAAKQDDMWETARVIYLTDPFIYPSWYDTAEKFADAIAPRMRTKGFIFHYSNLYVAKYEYSDEPIAVLSILTNKTDLNYGYKKLRRQSERVIDEYIHPVIKTVQALPDKVAYGLSLAVEPYEREKGVAEKLFRYAIKDLKKRGIDTLYFDCLSNNVAALRLYQKLGFSIVDEGFGFKKTGATEEVLIVTLSGTF